MFSKYSKALVVGAGSGRDIASSILISETLREQRIDVDLAGFLTPWALHEFNGELEKTLNKSSKPSRKFLATQKEVSLDSYFEPELAEINEELDLGIGEIYLFSLQYGTERVRTELERLVRQGGYDLIIAVDAGGDILAHRKDLAFVYTPIVDLTCLYVLADLKTTTDKYLAVVAPGVDGEIPSQRLAELIREEGILRREQLTTESRNYQTFVQVYDEINRRTKSTSQTGAMIRKVVEGQSNFTEGYKRKGVSFTVQLDKELASGIYYFDLETVKSRRRDMVVFYEDISEAHNLMKEMGCGGTEMDLI